MRLLMTMEADVSEEALKSYYAKYPDFVEDGEPQHVEETFLREAVAAWDFEELLTEGFEPRLVEENHNRNIVILSEDLYKLALAAHCPDGKPCDPDLECQDCTLLIIAAEDLKLPDPFDAWLRAAEAAI